MISARQNLLGGRRPRWDYVLKCSLTFTFVFVVRQEEGTTSRESTCIRMCALDIGSLLLFVCTRAFFSCRYTQLNQKSNTPFGISETCSRSEYIHCVRHKWTTTPTDAPTKTESMMIISQKIRNVLANMVGVFLLLKALMAAFANITISLYTQNKC